jgi:hypothetical protein
MLLIRHTTHWSPEQRWVENQGGNDAPASNNADIACQFARKGL